MRTQKPSLFQSRLFYKGSQRSLSIPHSLKVALLLFTLGILAYGILLPQMGFYWDDWPWIWLQHVDGKAGMLAIDRGFRPLSGVTLWLFSQVAGERPIFWQGINLFLRWFSSFTCYLALSAIFPQQKEKVVWVAGLFLLYPGYTHQFVAVNSSRHILPFSWFFLSLWVMVQNARAVKFSWLKAIGALGLQSLGMLTTEYFYGLELARPFILWLVLDRLSDKKQRLKCAVLHALPYLGVFTAIVIWRYAITRLPGYSNYSVNLFEESELTNSSSLLLILQEWLRQLYVGLVLGWLKGFEFPQPSTFGVLKSLAYGLLVLTSAVFVGVFLAKLKPVDKNEQSKGLMLLGMTTLAVGGLPFLAAGLTMDLGFTASRLTLPMALGSSLLWVGLLDRLPVRRLAKIPLIAILCGLAVGAHFRNAVAFQRDWSYQRAFFEQLRWRAPQIKPGTLILSNTIAETHSSDNSLTAALNWLYFNRIQGEELPLLYFYVEPRRATYFPEAVRGVAIERQYGRFLFRGNTDQTLVIYFEPPACLRLIDPELGAINPTLSKEIRQVAHLSNLEQVEITAKQDETDLPLTFKASDKSWCYFYQKADLARQQGKWAEVVEWGERGLTSGDSPNRADERIPFIQGHAMIGNWSEAQELTIDAIRINPNLSPVLCKLWQDLEQTTPPSDGQKEAIYEVMKRLRCGVN